MLSDFAKADREWVEALCDAIADNAALLATGPDASFQNKVHLALQAKGILDKGDNGEKKLILSHAGLVPGIHVFVLMKPSWMAGTSPRHDEHEC